MQSKAAIVMGLGPSGLFLVRQLHNRTNTIYAIGRDNDVGMYSRYISKKYIAENDDSVIAALEEISHLEKQKAELYICSDQYLTLMISSTTNWEKFVDIIGVNSEKIQMINDKPSVNQYCTNNGIQIPETLSMNEFIKLEKQFFPIIIKWNEKKLDNKPNPIGKVLVCPSEDDFKSLLKEIEVSSVSTDDLFVQNFISGNNNWQYSVGGFYKDGVSLASVVVKQVKQYPQGISAEVYTSEDEIAMSLRRIAFGFAEKLSYTGFLEMEFKIDSESGISYLLDVNPRPWGWVSILGGAFPDFYRVLDGINLMKDKRNARWSSPIRKLLSLKNKNNVKTVTGDSRYQKTYDIWDVKDIKPGIMIYFIGLIKKVKK